MKIKNWKIRLRIRIDEKNRKMNMNKKTKQLIAEGSLRIRKLIY